MVINNSLELLMYLEKERRLEKMKLGLHKQDMYHLEENMSLGRKDRQKVEKLVDQAREQRKIK